MGDDQKSWAAAAPSVPVKDQGNLGAQDPATILSLATRCEVAAGGLWITGH